MRLSLAQYCRLETMGWGERVGNAAALWVSVTEQRLRLIRGEEVVLAAPCSTAKNGVGAAVDSLKTPPGWHAIVERIGEDAPWGQVFRSKRPTHEIWQPGNKSGEDLVLTRVLVLDGQEPGINKGGDVDSFARFIYIHGTNDEARIGQAYSHGCIRLTNDDVIKVCDSSKEGMLVLISG